MWYADIMSNVHVALDLDRTLAFYEGGGPIGKVVPDMINNINTWLNKGYKISIFTARLSRFNKDGTRRFSQDIERNAQTIRKLLNDNGLPPFEITSDKRPYFTHFVDDKAVAVEPNQGNILFDLSRQL